MNRESPDQFFSDIFWDIIVQLIYVVGAVKAIGGVSQVKRFFPSDLDLQKMIYIQNSFIDGQYLEIDVPSPVVIEGTLRRILKGLWTYQVIKMIHSEFDRLALHQIHYFSYDTAKLRPLSTAPTPDYPFSCRVEAVQYKENVQKLEKTVNKP